MARQDGLRPEAPERAAEYTELKLFVAPDLYRAFQRCVWILAQEQGRDRREIMEEAVRDFLVKHGC